jgi:hypothetical protein
MTSERKAAQDRICGDAQGERIVAAGFIGGTKPELVLTDIDGNAFVILGTAKKAAQRAGIAADEVSRFVTEATSGDYFKLVASCMYFFEVL